MVKRVARVSSYGRFESTLGVVSTPAPTRSGYVRVRIDKKHYQIHRLIAAAFALPREAGQDTVDHIDGDPRNNRLDNLRYASQAEQVRHSYATNATRKSSAPRQSKPVRGRKRGDGADWVRYASASEAARVLGVDSGSVRACCAGKVSHAGGYEFEWAPPQEPQMLAGEEWRAVSGARGARVSSYGRFQSTRGVVTTPAPLRSGYVYVHIGNKGYLIHRLIAAAFALPCEPGQDTVDHIDGNPRNNRLDNLRYASQAEQVQHSYATNATRKSNAPRRSKPVRGRKRGADWVRYASAKEAARALGVYQGAVSNCCAKKISQTGGYEFEWAPPQEPQMLDGEVWRAVVCV
jgi:hypothetical protein